MMRRSIATGRRPVPTATAGFTLVELAASAALLVATICAGTGLVCLACEQVASTVRTAATADAVLQVTATLDGLPYCASPGGTSIVEQVFPHAQSARNVADAFYVASATGSWPAGCFVHRRRVGGSALELVACFLRRGPDGDWEPLVDRDLQGRDFSSEAPPAVRLEIRAGVRGRSLGGRVYVARAVAGEPAP
jgi:hypothetical protein